MNTLEFRKVIMVGFRCAMPVEGKPLLDPQGMPITKIEGAVTIRCVFWIPQRPPFQRRGVELYPRPFGGLMARPDANLEEPLEGYTLVPNPLPHEMDALRAGVLVEEVYDFNYPRFPSVEQGRRDTTPIWERRVLEVLGYLPNGAPVDRDPKFALFFSGRDATVRA